MIIDFTVSNFRSIKEPQTISFEATDDWHLEDYYAVAPVFHIGLFCSFAGLKYKNNEHHRIKQAKHHRYLSKAQG